MNNVSLVGRLTAEPELRYTGNGTPVASFTLAVNRPFAKDTDQQKADFINIIVWRKPAENCANFLKKGSQAGIAGRMQTRNYEGQDGKRVYVTEVIAEHVHFLDPKPQNVQNRSETNQNNISRNDNPFSGNGQIDISDDDLPF